jgi:hypothetical protein
MAITKSKKKRDSLKISSSPSFDLSTPKGMDPRVKDMPNWDLYEKKLKKKQEQMKGVKLPPV